MNFFWPQELQLWRDRTSPEGESAGPPRVHRAKCHIGLPGCNLEVDDPGEEAPALGTWCLCRQMETDQERHLVQARSWLWCHDECSLWRPGMRSGRFGVDEQHCVALPVLPWSHGSWQGRGWPSWCPHLCWAKAFPPDFRLFHLLVFFVFLNTFWGW